MMKHSLKITMVVVVAIGALWFGFKHFNTKNGAIKSKESTHVSFSTSRMEIEPEVASASDAVPTKAQQIKPEFAIHLDRLVEEYVCNPGVDCEQAINVATSRNEALWLERRGYPSDSELLDLQAMPLGKLEELAEAKDLAAMAVYGDRLVKSGDAMKGLAQLHQALLHGSTYAAYKFAEAFQKEASVADLSESAAYYRLAYLEGDWKAPVQLYINHPRITVGELEVAERRALVLYYRLLEQKAKQGLTLQVGVRPFEE